MRNLSDKNARSCSNTANWISTRKVDLAFEIQLAQDVTPILTFDGTLPRSEESSLVLGTVYFHFRCPLWR